MVCKKVLVFSAFLALAVAVLPSIGYSKKTKKVVKETPVLSGEITGIVMQSVDIPMAYGKVAVFKRGEGPPPNPSRYLRPPDDRGDIEEDGRFRMTLPVGDYYLTAVKSQDGDLLGPPREDDFIYPGTDSLQKGETVYSIRAGEIVDIGSVQAHRFSKKLYVEAEDVTTMEGTVRDQNGKPLPGSVVLAFGTSDVVGKPLFISERTDLDGRYQLRVAKGGTFYLKSRTSLFGGIPEDGEYIGVYGMVLPAPVEIKTREGLTGVNIVAKPFIDKRKKTWTGKNKGQL